MTEPMTGATGQPQRGWYDNTPATDEQIETIRHDLAAGPPLGSAAFARQAVRKLLAAYDRDHAELAKLRPEYGIRATFVSGPDLELTVAETLDNALAALDEFDARHRDAVVSRELIERPVGKWRKVGDDA